MSNPRHVSSLQRPLIFGEVLFDCFAQARVLGGAPFNVAWNLKGFGVDPLVVTAVGNDQLGQEVLQRVAFWGLDSEGLQICQAKPTGRVDIETIAGEPTYRFWDDVAFDHIHFDPQLMATAEPALLYHGSLALRSPLSRQTIQQIRDRLKNPSLGDGLGGKSCPLFVDVNIRLPHYDPALAERMLNRADHVKLNHEELNLLAAVNWPEPAGEAARWQFRRELGERLIKQYEIGNLWITAAEEGAAWLTASGDFYHAPAPKVIQLVDTVGAGDALTAVIIYGLLHHKKPEQILDNATHFAARVCSIRGAITDDRAFYEGAVGNLFLKPLEP